MRDSAAASAPGRVNLIGEHTDYHDGLVLPMAIPQQTRVSLRRRQDRCVRATSAQLSPIGEEYRIGNERVGRGWLDYVQGVTVMLGRRGIDVPGFDASIESTVPVGAGVSSSAALEVSLLRALRLLLEFDLDDVALARLAHAAETGFVGTPVGVMDQVASSLGVQGEALFFDTRTFAIDRVPLPSTLEIIAIHSGVTHAHASGEYSARRRESFAAAHRLGVQWLRDIDTAALDRIAGLPPALSRRARHVVTENARVIEAVAALRRADGPRLGALFTASHASMRDDYEISTPDIDTLVTLAAQQPGVYGARLTGGGFGGAVVAIAAAGTGHDAAQAISTAYAAQTGLTPSVLLPSAIR
jgi:galactokinase